MSDLEALRRQLEEEKQKAKEAARKRAEAVEARMLLDEIEAQKAWTAACEKYGDHRVLPVIKLDGLGHVVLRYPDKARWRSFCDRGVLKADKLTGALCDEVVSSGLCYPDQARFNEYGAANPNAAIVMTELLVKAMRPETDEEGKE